MSGAAVPPELSLLNTSLCMTFSNLWQPLHSLTWTGISVLFHIAAESTNNLYPMKARTKSISTLAEKTELYNINNTSAYIGFSKLVFCFFFLLKKLHFESWNIKIIRTSHIFLKTSLETAITVLDFTCIDCYPNGFRWMFLHHQVVILRMEQKFLVLLDYQVISPKEVFTKD